MCAFARLNPSQLGDYSITSINGIPVPLSAVATINTTVTPESINHFQQQNSATLGGVVAPGVSQADALATMQKLAAQILPEGYVSDYAGPLRQFVQESNSFLITFGFAVIIIFLSLAALFNSFRDPLIILVSVPMSIAGALIFIYLGFGGVSLNIYTEVGLVTLMGLVSKHGILMVDVANVAQLQGQIQARGNRVCCQHPAAADFNDDGSDGAGRGAANPLQRRRCCCPEPIWGW